MTRENTKKLTLSAMFFALGIVLPFLIGQIPAIGKMLSPMHIPVLFCGLIVGWKYGLIVGFLLPLVRSVLFGMPALFPNATGMAFELGTYGFVIALVYSSFPHKNTMAVYISLITAMLAGRIVWGIAQVIMLGVTGGTFTFQAFITIAFVNAIPAIILQLILIPVVMASLDKAGIVCFTS